jgi:hypothetical protein
MNLDWWMLPIAILIVVVWAGWYLFMFTRDRRRNQEVATDRERLDVDPHGPTSIPRDQQDPDTRGPGV